MPEFKALIFDMDGVLADTASVYFPLMKKYLHEHSIDVTDEDIAQLVGFNFVQKVRYLNEKYGIEVNHKEFVEEVSAKARKEHFHELKEEPGAKELISELKSNKIKIALATANGDKNVEVILKAIGLSDLFDAKITTSHTTHAKPHPEVYLKALEALQLKPEECIVIEDTVIGIESAKKAGIKAIAFPNQFNYHHNFSEADKMISSLKELNYLVLKDLVEKNL
ncbi:MAG: HAD family phosphatase [Candidatus Diapherotrites archaeon]